MNITLFPPLNIYELGQRTNQEDAIAQWNNRLFILCDGMGGHERGEVASQTVCQSLVNWFRTNVNPNEPFCDDQLLAALEYTYTELDKQDDGGLKKMGTTLTLLYFHRQGATAAHIGDSRIYHIRPLLASPKLGEARRGLKGEDGLLYQSRDHSLVFDLYQAGEITFEEMRTSPQKNIITRAMQPGESNRVRADIVHITNILPGDYFYLCSDGMLENMTDEELVAFLSADGSDEQKRQRLVEATLGNQDNHSAWLIHVKDVIQEEGDALLVDEERTSRFNAINIHPTLAATDDEDVSIVEVAEPARQVTPPPIPQRVKSPMQKMYADWKKLLLFLIAILLLFFIGYRVFKPEKKDVRVDPVMVQPGNVGQNKTAKDSSKISKDSLRNKNNKAQDESNE